MSNYRKINRRDFVSNLSQSALALALLGRSTQSLAANKKISINHFQFWFWGLGYQVCTVHFC